MKCKSILRHTNLLIAITSFFIGYGLAHLMWRCSAAFTGAGHGTYVFYLLAGSPSGYFFWLWPFVILFLNSRIELFLYLGILALGVHYIALIVSFPLVVVGAHNIIAMNDEFDMLLVFGILISYVGLTALAFFGVYRSRGFLKGNRTTPATNRTIHATITGSVN